jgi:8-oxo-dGTP pyrophosphatase MutT (NUDIX family)
MLAPHRLGAKAALVHEGRILLIEYDDGGDSLHYNLPGGGIEPGERIRAALQREILEETGCRAEIGPLLLASEYFPPDHRFAFGTLPKLTLIFQASLIPGTAQEAPSAPDESQTGVRWFPLDQIPASLIPHFHDLLLQALAGGVSDPFTVRA